MLGFLILVSHYSLSLSLSAERECIFSRTSCVRSALWDGCLSFYGVFLGMAAVSGFAHPGKRLIGLLPSQLKSAVVLGRLLPSLSWMLHSGSEVL